MATTLAPVLSDHWDADRSWTLATYEAHYMEEYVDAFMKNKEANAR